MINYSDKFTVIIKDKNEHIKSVANVVGGNYAEVENAAKEIVDKDFSYEIVKDKVLFDVVYHFEGILTNLHSNALDMLFKITNANKAKFEFEDYE